MESRKLYRSYKDRIIGGICGGIAEYFNINSVIVRLFFLFSFLFFKIIVIIYIILLIIIPLDPGYSSKNRIDNLRKVSVFWGLAFISLGSFFLLLNFGINFFYKLNFSWSIFFSIILISLGIYIIINRSCLYDRFSNNELQLTKVSEGKMLFGVCNGISYYTNIDVSIIRIFWILFTFSSFLLSIIIYLSLTILLPKDKIFAEEGKQ